jgi:hypothetical protein
MDSMKIVVNSVSMIIPCGALHQSRSSRHLRCPHHPHPPAEKEYFKEES